MKPSLLVRTLHKWLGLFVGLQLVLWTVSGFYMVVVDLDFIHGDSLVRNLRAPLTMAGKLVSVTSVAERYPAVTQVALRSLGPESLPVYEVTTDGHTVLVDAQNGRQLSPLSQDAIRQLARHYYAGPGRIAMLTLIERNPPLEIKMRTLPLWRVDFDDWLQASLYLHPDTGTLVTRRHRLWRWFDFLWMFHIMDYEGRTDMNNGLLRAATSLGLATVWTGMGLLYFSFRRRSIRGG